MFAQSVTALDQTREQTRVILREYLDYAMAALERHGVQLHIHTDFERLKHINRQNRPYWFPIMPMFDHDCSSLEGYEDAFWLEGRARDGRCLVTQCERRYLLSQTTVGNELSSLRFFYDDPQRFAAEREICLCDAPSADFLAGNVSYSGGLWVHPELRGNYLSSHMMRISRALAMILWDSDYNLALVEPVLVEKGVVAGYGYPGVEPGVSWVGSPIHGDLNLLLVWMDRLTLVRDLEAVLTGAETARVGT